MRHAFPEVGEEMPGAVKTLRDLKRAGHKIILWTCRTGRYLCEMILWCDGNGVPFDQVNCNVFNAEGFAMPKVYADVYIDDRNFGGFPGWDAVRKEYLDAGDVRKEAADDNG